jgi:methionyl-tRNA formyltransferase
MFAVRDTEIDGKTAGALTAELAALGGALMVEVLDRLAEIRPTPQPAEGVTYASKIEKQEARLEFGASAIDVERRIRAFNPAPGAFFEFGTERIKLLAATVIDQQGIPGTILDDRMTIACGEGAIAPLVVQRAGRGPMAPDELLRGFALPRGTLLA